MANQLGGSATSLTSNIQNANIGNAGQGDYWIGADNNVYTKVAGQNGVQKLGPMGVISPNAYAGLTRIADPNAPSSGSGQVQGDTTNTPGVATTSINPYGSTSSGGLSSSDIAAYQDDLNSLQNLLSQSDVQQQNGLNAYDQSYNNGLAGLNQSQSAVLSGYATQKNNATNNYQGNLQTINNDARNGYNGLMALLGNSGSAGNILAPYAVSQTANQQKQGAQKTYAQNLAGIDTATNQSNQDYQNKLNDLLTQKNTGIQKLISDIDAQKQNYLAQIAADQNQINIAKGGSYSSMPDIKAQIAALQADQNSLSSRYATPTLTVNPVTANPVNLSDYLVQAAQLAGNSNNTPDSSSSDISAIAGLPALLKQNQNTYSY